MRSEPRETGGVKSWSSPGIIGVGWGSPELWGRRACGPRWTLFLWYWARLNQMNKVNLISNRTNENSMQ